MGKPHEYWVFPCCVYIDGATGPTGATGAIPQVSGIQAALRGLEGAPLARDANIVFDNVINRIGTAITYNDPPTGVFTISQNGNYRVDWWATIDGTSATIGITLALNIGTTVHSRAVAPPVTSQVSGSALITVDAAPVTLFITNISNGEITFEGDIDVQANIVITALPS